MGAVKPQKKWSDYTYPVLLLLVFFFIIYCVVIIIRGPEVLKEPFGVYRVGAVRDYLAPVSYGELERLLFRYDDNGLSVMSTRFKSAGFRN